MHIHSCPLPREKRLELKDSFNFSCRREYACFGSCCRNRELALTPYDVVRLKTALSLQSDFFLARHTVYRLDPSTGFPVISLKLKPDGEKHCPFLNPDGCSVYDHRPTVCRLFPLARASGFKPNSDDHDEFFYMLPTTSCLGMEETGHTAVEDWLHSQGLNPYREANDRMLRLLFHRARPTDRTLNERQLQNVIVALYNLDVFREFTLRTDIFNAFPMDNAAREGIGKDDFALLDFGFAYLEKFLFT